MWFPWGSLLRGVLGLDDTAAGGLAALVRPEGGRVDALVSAIARDGLDGVASLDGPAIGRLAAAHGRFGLALVSAALATAEEVRATRSSWGLRLLAAGSDRPVWRLSLRQRG